MHGDRRHEGRPPGRGAQYAVVAVLLLLLLRGLLCGRVVVEPVAQVRHGRCRTVVQLLRGHGTVLQVEGFHLEFTSWNTRQIIYTIAICPRGYAGNLPYNRMFP